MLHWCMHVADSGWMTAVTNDCYRICQRRHCVIVICFVFLLRHGRTQRRLTSAHDNLKVAHLQVAQDS